MARGSAWGRARLGMRGHRPEGSAPPRRFRGFAGEADYGRGAAPGASAGECPSEPAEWRAAMASRAAAIVSASR